MLSPRIKGAVCHDPEVDQRFPKEKIKETYEKVSKQIVDADH